METTIWSAARFGLDLTLKVTFLLTLILLLIAAFRRLSASSRHLLAMLGLGGALALALVAPFAPAVKIPLVPSLLPSNAGQAQGKAPEKWAAAPPASARVHTSPRTVWHGQPSVDRPGDVEDVVQVTAAGPAAVSSAAAVVSPRPRVPAVTPFNCFRIALAIWTVGAVFFLSRLAFGWARLSRISATAEPVLDPGWTSTAREVASHLGLSRPVRLLASGRVPVAMTAGVRRPVLLLHDGARKWSPERRRVVLLHELAHVRRRDWITLLVAEIAAAVYWFHPLVWLARREARRSCERACDDLVLDAGTKPSVYAAHLLGIVRSLKPARAAALPVMAMARPSQFEGRMRAILDPGLHRRGPSRAATRGAALGALFAVVSLGAVHPWVEQACAAACPQESTVSKPRAWSASAASAGKTRDGRKPCAGKPSREAEAVQPEASAPEPAPAAAPPGFVLASNARQRTGEEWYAKAMELHNDERYDEAIAAFQKSIDLGYREPAAAYNIACGYARKKNVSSAFTWLEKAKDLGFPVAEYLESDDDLESLHKDPRFVTMRKEARAKEVDDHPEAGKRAAKAFERLESRGAQDGSALFQNGRDLLAAGEYSLAAKAFRRSGEVGYRAGASFYNEACSLALGGERAPALDALRRSIENGYDDPDHMRKDDDLDAIRSEPRYREIETLADDLQMPSIGWGSEFLRSTRRTEWRQAARHAEQMTVKYPRLGRSWFNLGFAELRSDRPEAAAEAFQQALELGYRKPATTYNVACSYARLGRKDVAFEWLFRALDAGFDSDGTIRGDDDLDNLRGDPRYRKALDTARAKSRNQE